MTFLLKAALIVLFLCASTLPAKAEDTVAQFRYLSTVLRDSAPTVSESKEFAAAKDKTAKLSEFVSTWMASDAFDQRLRRHFHDMFGIEPYTFVAEQVFDLHRFGDETAIEPPEDLAENGVFYLKSSVKPSCGGAPITTTAWWTEGSIRICPSAVSSAISVNGNWCPDAFGATGIRHADCGCGPEQVLCWPNSARGKLQTGVVNEFAERGRYIYEENKSWNDLFGGDLFIGNRWLYHHYVYQQRIVVSALPPTSAQLALMRSLPDNEVGEAVLPNVGPQRAGVVTMPSFLRRYNNFRSRVRAVTEQLLCQDIDGGLNTSGIDFFVNDDLSDFDKSHGDQEGCASCHFAMDNMGSTLLGWGDGGFFEAWWPRSQDGHVFGEDGSGPRFLMQQIISHSEKFVPCMAKKTWEGFSGESWDVLSASERQEFLSAASDGPRHIIQSVLTSNALRNLRANDSKTITKTVAVTYDFATDVSPILEKSCATSNCHGSDGLGGQYIDQESFFRAADVTRIQSGSMPPPGSGMTISQAERDLLVLYLKQD